MLARGSMIKARSSRQGNGRHSQRAQIVIKGDNVNGGRAKQVSINDGAHQNRKYVRRLLTQNSPEFAAVLDWVVWEFVRRRDPDLRTTWPASARLATPIWDGADEPASDVRHSASSRPR